MELRNTVGLDNRVSILDLNSTNIITIHLQNLVDGLLQRLFFFRSISWLLDQMECQRTYANFPCSLGNLFYATEIVSKRLAESPVNKNRTNLHGKMRTFLPPFKSYVGCRQKESFFLPYNHNSASKYRSPPPKKFCLLQLTI